MVKYMLEALEIVCGGGGGTFPGNDFHIIFVGYSFWVEAPVLEWVFYVLLLFA